MVKDSTFPYFITWTANEAHVFKLPTGGTSTMVRGENMLYFANTEQCLSFCSQFRVFKIPDYKIYRNFIEVTFDLGENGIFSVAATNQNTNELTGMIDHCPEKRSVTITGASIVTEEEINNQEITEKKLNSML